MPLSREKGKMLRKKEFCQMPKVTTLEVIYYVSTGRIMIGRSVHTQITSSRISLACSCWTMMAMALGKVGMLKKKIDTYCMILKIFYLVSKFNYPRTVT